MKIIIKNLGKSLIVISILLLGFSAGAQTYNWQQFKTILPENNIKDLISPYCAPIDPKDTVDPNFCYILQRQCWMDKSGFGPCVVKNCRFGRALDGRLTDAPFVEPPQYYWYCELGPNQTPAVVPPPECSPLDEIWKDRILRDPTCQPK